MIKWKALKITKGLRRTTNIICNYRPKSVLLKKYRKI